MLTAKAYQGVRRGAHYRQIAAKEVTGLRNSGAAPGEPDYGSSESAAGRPPVDGTVQHGRRLTMTLPRILIAVSLIVAGAFIPAAGAAPAAAPAGAVGMEHEDFKVKDVRLHRGETLTFANDS